MRMKAVYSSMCASFIIVKKVPDLTFLHAYLEYVFIRYRKSGKDYFVGQFYIPPGADLSSFLVKFTSILHTLSVD